MSTPDEAQDFEPFTFPTGKMDITFRSVDPELLGLLTGGVMGTPPPPTFAIEVTTLPRGRTFWEWLRRKPRHLGSCTYIPHARMVSGNSESGV